MADLKHVAVLMPVGSYTMGVLEGISEYVKRHGPLVAWVNLEIHDTFEPIATWKGDGIIAGVTKSIYGSVKRSGLPVVNVLGSLPDMDIPRVMCDHIAIGRLAARHLLERRFTSFGYIGRLDYYAGDLRRQGFEDEVRGNGHACQVLDHTLIQRSVGYSSQGREHLSRWIRSLPKPVGVMAFDDQIAMDVAYQCLQIGVRIPEELALVGVDDEKSVCEMAVPAISSVRVPWDLVGYEATVLLHRLMAGKRPPRQPILIEPTAVTVRQSTDILAVDDLDAATALAYIRRSGGDPIGVDDVVSHTSCCRRVLERRFQKVFGRTISKVLLEARMNLAKNALADMFKPIQIVAHACGFKSSSHFGMVFRREMGMSPAAYRKQLSRHAK